MHIHIVSFGVIIAGILQIDDEFSVYIRIGQVGISGNDLILSQIGVKGRPDKIDGAHPFVVVVDRRDIEAVIFISPFKNQVAVVFITQFTCTQVVGFDICHLIIGAVILPYYNFYFRLCILYAIIIEQYIKIELLQSPAQLGIGIATHSCLYLHPGLYNRKTHFGNGIILLIILEDIHHVITRKFPFHFITRKLKLIMGI